MTPIDPSAPDRSDDGPDHAKPPTEAKVKMARLGAGLAALGAASLIRYIPALEPLQGSDQFLTGLLADGIVALLSAGAAWAGGYWAKHTRRPDLPMTQR